MKSAIQKKLLILVVSLLLTSEPAAANTSAGTAAAVAGVAGLIVGLFAASHSDTPPPTPVVPRYIPPPVHIYTLEEKAEMGNVSAQLQLAQNYENGTGVTRNDAKAFKWYLTASRTENSFAELKLANMYESGRGVPSSTPDAVIWYYKSASHGNSEAMSALTKYALQGNQIAEIGLGDIYKNGYGTPVDGNMAIKWYSLAAEAGNPTAQNDLGVMYEDGKDVPRDYVTALRWYKYAARQGDAYGQSNLGRMYFAGKGTSVDHVKAYKWLSLAAVQKNSYAEQALPELEKSMSPDDVVEGQEEARDFVAQPPYTKREMNFLNDLDDIRLFVEKYFTPLLGGLFLASLFLMKKYFTKSDGKISVASSAFFTRTLTPIKQKLAKCFEMPADKTFFEALQIKFWGENKFRSIVALCACLFLIISNPTQKDFDTYFRHRIEKYGDGNKFADFVATSVMHNITERHSYLLFSVFGFDFPFLSTLDEKVGDKKFIGVGGTIIPI